MMLLRLCGSPFMKSSAFLLKTKLNPRFKSLLVTTTSKSAYVSEYSLLQQRLDMIFSVNSGNKCGHLLARGSIYNTLISGNAIKQNFLLSTDKYTLLATSFRQIYNFKGNEVKKNDNGLVGLSKRDQLKKAFKECGAIIIGFHIILSIVSLSGFYILVISGVDITSWLHKLNVPLSSIPNKVTIETGYFVIAYAVHKLCAPIRIGITLSLTPFIMRHFRNKKFLKNHANKK